LTPVFAGYARARRFVAESLIQTVEVGEILFAFIEPMQRLTTQRPVARRRDHSAIGLMAEFGLILSWR
jgi:hypothetical protein